MDDALRNQIIKKFLDRCLVVDTESTGLDPSSAEICEIGVTRIVDGKEKTTDKLFGTRLPIPYAASAKNNISRKMLEGLPTVVESMEEISEMLHVGDMKKKYFVAHNFEYDKEILESSFTLSDPVSSKAHQLSEEIIDRVFDTKWICTYRLAKHLFHPSDEDKDLSYSLNYLRYAFDLPVEGTVHRAGDDTKVTWELLRFISEFVLETMDDVPEDFDLGEYLFELSKSPVPYTVMPFGKWKGTPLADVPDDYYQWMLNKSDILKEDNDNYDPDFAKSVENELNRRMGN